MIVNHLITPSSDESSGSSDSDSTNNDFVKLSGGSDIEENNEEWCDKCSLIDANDFIGRFYCALYAYKL